MLARLRIFFMAAFMVAVSAFGWDDTGHMVIAAIAYRHLTPKARAEVGRLLGSEDFLDAACWADDIRSQRRETARWHYIDLHFRADGRPSFNQPARENVVVAIGKFEGVLADKRGPDAERMEALEFLMHFVGDVHQPLHATSRDTDQYPMGDAGGNKFRIEPPDLTDNNWRPRNLHALWDLGCGLFPSNSYDRRPLSSVGRRYIEGIASQIEADFPMDKVNSWKDLNPMDWAQESFGIAKGFVYSLDEGTVPSDDYLARGRQISARRAALAGYRLAAVLNRILG
jgi:hypothetical protein